MYFRQTWQIIKLKFSFQNQAFLGFITWVVAESVDQDNEMVQTGPIGRVDFETLLKRQFSDQIILLLEAA